MFQGNSFSCIHSQQVQTLPIGAIASSGVWKFLWICLKSFYFGQAGQLSGSHILCFTCFTPLILINGDKKNDRILACILLKNPHSTSNFITDFVSIVFNLLLIAQSKHSLFL